MALWLVRAGKHGEYELKFVGEKKIYLTWNRLKHDLSKVKDQKSLRNVLETTYPDNSKGHITQNLGQIWAYSKKMKTGDWFVLPSKLKPVIHVGEISGDYKFNASSEDPYFHSRTIKWIKKDIPRSNFDQDLLYSFGACLTICQVRRNDGEERVKKMSKNDWKSTRKSIIESKKDDGKDAIDQDIENVDFEELATDQIAKLIIAKFKGHGMSRLVDGILAAQGYATYLSPEGPDKGVDILAGKGPMGFDDPKICVQVKSQESPVDRPTLDQLIGTMQNVQAEYGLLVSWGGFKSSVDREKASQFFKVRLWDQIDLIEQLLKHYDKLDEELRADLPLKRIWTIANVDEDAS